MDTNNNGSTLYSQIAANGLDPAAVPAQPVIPQAPPVPVPQPAVPAVDPVSVPVMMQVAPAQTLQTPSTPTTQVAPVAAVPVVNGNDTTEYQKLMDEEHHMMRYLPEDLKQTQAGDGYKVSKGPDFNAPETAAPVTVAEPIANFPGDPPVAAPAQAVLRVSVPTMPANTRAAAIPALAEEENVMTNLQPTDAEALPAVTPPPSLDVKTEGLSDEETLTYKNQLDDLLTLAIEKNASDLHICVDYPPQLRIDGRLVAIGTLDMTAVRVEKMFNAILDERLAKELEKESDVDFSYPHKSGNRFRVNLYFNKGALAGAFRLIPSRIKSIAELNLPQICYELIKVPQGLILFTGPTGSGKSTSIAAMIQELNLNTTKHIITIEDPIEYVFPKARSVVNQREIGQDASSWQRALRELLREDPNVVLVGEMRDYETIAATITVAETGHLVFATLHTNSASQTVDRIIDVFPEGQQNQIRSQLANVIVAVIAQRLIPVAHGGRKAVFEVMIATPAVKNAIREGKTFQIDNMIQTSADVGMITLEKSLLELIKTGDLSIDQAMGYTPKPDELMSLLNSGR